LRASANLRSAPGGTRPAPLKGAGRPELFNPEPFSGSGHLYSLSTILCKFARQRKFA